MLKLFRSNNFGIFILRLLMLYIAYGLCRVVFGIYNYELIAPVTWGDIPSIIRGSLVFDSASILYINIPFILMSLLPFHFRERRGYQQALKCVFLVLNGLGLAINIADIFYFPFKLSRIASDDLHFLAEGNFGALMGSFFKDFWWGFLLWAVIMVGLWICFTKVSFRPAKRRLLQPVPFFISQLLLMAAFGGFMIFAIRGFTASKASYPINMSDASLFVNPRHAPLVLSNPFCLIRTMGQKVSYPKFYDEELLDQIYPVEHPVIEIPAVRIDGRPNVVFLVLESFGSAHLKSFSDQFSPDDVSYSPFLDSLAAESYIFTDAYQNGLRSIDAMPAIWASIPSFKVQFLSMPNSVAPYKALPSCLADMGYTTAFLHGSVRESMGFVAFGQMAGVRNFVSREDYEAVYGSGDFDGKWGIWDHKFIPFAADKISELPRPFNATLFTLSSHHPFQLPEGFEGLYPEGNLPIHKMVAYTDSVLRDFFAKAKEQGWYENTLFIITADHGAGGDTDKYRQMPYRYAVPLIFHYSGSNLTRSDYWDSNHLGQAGTGTAMKGRNDTTTQHINIMPTVLRMLGYDKEFFSFGRDMFNDADSGFAINYYGSAFNYMAGSKRYVFNEKDVVGVYDYKTDPVGEHDLGVAPSDSTDVARMKAFIQQYYRHLKNRKYTVGSPQ